MGISSEGGGACESEEAADDCREGRDAHEEVFMSLWVSLVADG